MQISCIRLSDKTSRLHPRHAVPKPAQAYELEVPERRNAGNHRGASAVGEHFKPTGTFRLRSGRSQPSGDSANAGARSSWMSPTHILRSERQRILPIDRVRKSHRMLGRASGSMPRDGVTSQQRAGAFACHAGACCRAHLEDWLETRIRLQFRDQRSGRRYLSA